jgi:hypothetical protein
MPRRWARAFARSATAVTAPFCGQQRALRWWLIGPSEDRTCCKIVVIWRLSALDLCRAEHLDTAPQLCGLKHDHERFSRQVPLQTNCAAFKAAKDF